MASIEAELEQQLKESGKQLSHPPDSVDELLPVLDQVEKLLSKVDQSPKKSMLDALKPSMRALIQDSLSGHSDVDVKVAVAACISEITRITAPDAPYNDDQMRDVFQLIVSSFEDLANQSSRSYSKRASILETVSKVRSCVIMLDLECDGLIVEMFEHFLRSVRDYHLESIYSSMENIMVLVLEESEEVSVEMLKPILASVKKDSEGVLPIARKLGEGVLLKSAAKLKPYLMPAVVSIGDTLDMYSPVVASVCEGTTAAVEQNDENASGVQLANESKSTKGSLDEAQQADESKLTTASSDHTDQVVKEENCPDDEDPALDRSPKSVMSNGVKADEEASVDQEPSKKPQEDENEQKLDKGDTDADDDESDADVAKPESKPEPTSKKGGTKSDTVVNSGEPSDSSHVEGEKEEAEKQPDVHTSPVKESSNEAVNPSETEKDEPAPESKAENVSSPSPSQSDSIPEESHVKKPIRSKKKQVPQKDETAPENTASPSKSGSPKKGGRAKNKAAAAKEVKLPATVDESEDGGAASDSDDKPLKKPDKKVDAGGSGAKSSKQSGKKGKQPAKKTDAGESDGKKTKQGKKVEETSKQSAKKGEDSDSDAKPLKLSVKKGEKSKVESKNVEEDEESDSDSKPLKQSAKKGNAGNLGDVKSSSKKKDDGKKRGSGKTVTEKEQTKSLSEDEEMEESSPKSATKSAKGEGNSKETPGTSSKRKRNTGKDKVKYDKSLVGVKVKVWWPEDKTYYEGVIESFDSAKKKHKVSYVDGDEEILNLKTQKWEILDEFSPRDEEPDTEAQNEEEATPETHKKKKSKTDPTSSASQEKAKRAGATSSSAKTKGSSKDNKSTSQKPSAKSTEAAAKEAGKSKEDEETPKSKSVNKSKGKTPQAGTKSNSNNGPGKAKSGSEDVKTPETTKGGSKSGKKRKKRS